MEHPLRIGKYAINNGVPAWLDGNKLFQRHAVIVGSTGSGKSFTVATLLEKISELKSCNAIFFDIHGEPPHKHAATAIYSVKLIIEKSASKHRNKRMAEVRGQA